jgi:hypothetical protein
MSSPTHRGVFLARALKLLGRLKHSKGVTTLARHGRLRWAYFLPILHLWAPAVRAQSRETDLAFHGVPFRQWLAEGPKSQLPWRARVFAPELSQHQRIWARIQIEVDGNELLKRCCDGSSIALVEITDQQGRSYRNYAAQDLKEVKPGLSQYTVTLSWKVFLLPGDYQVTLALYYSGRKGHSLAVERLHVGALKNDPLPESWRGLPSVEFCDSQPEGVDEYLLPGVSGRLHLPIVTRRPIRVEVLENLTPYRAEQRHPTQYKERLGVFLPILKTFGQMEVTNGSLRLATLDFTRNRETFSQEGVKEGHVDWAELKGALAANVTTAIDVHDIRESEQYGVFFRQEAARRLAAEKESAGPEEDHALRVLVIVSGVMQFGFGRSISIAPPPDGNFVVYYLRCEFLPTPSSQQNILPLPQVQGQDHLEGFEQTVDGVGKALKDLKPRVFGVHSAEGVRKAIAAIVGEISRM